MNYHVLAAQNAYGSTVEHVLCVFQLKAMGTHDEAERYNKATIADDENRSELRNKNEWKNQKPQGYCSDLPACDPSCPLALQAHGRVSLMTEGVKPTLALPQDTPESKQSEERDLSIDVPILTRNEQLSRHAVSPTILDPLVPSLGPISRVHEAPHLPPCAKPLNKPRWSFQRKPKRSVRRSPQLPASSTYEVKFPTPEVDDVGTDSPEPGDTEIDSQHAHASEVTHSPLPRPTSAPMHTPRAKHKPPKLGSPSQIHLSQLPFDSETYRSPLGDAMPVVHEDIQGGGNELVPRQDSREAPPKVRAASGVSVSRFELTLSAARSPSSTREPREHHSPPSSVKSPQQVKNSAPNSCGNASASMVAPVVIEPDEKTDDLAPTDPELASHHLSSDVAPEAKGLLRPPVLSTALRRATSPGLPNPALDCSDDALDCSDDALEGSDDALDEVRSRFTVMSMKLL